MKRKLMQTLLTTAALIIFAMTGPTAFAQGDTKPKPTAKAEIKESGTEVKKAGTGLARNVKKGRIARGGKSFGKHIGSAGKHIGRSTKAATKTVIKP